MTAGRLGALASVIFFPLVAAAVAQPAAGTQPVELAQAPKGEPPPNEEEKQKRERTRPKSQEKGPADPQAPPPPKAAPPPPPVIERPPTPKAVPTPPDRELLPPPAKTLPPQPPAKQISPPPEKAPAPPAAKEPPPPEKRSSSPPVAPSAPPAAKMLPPDTPKEASPAPEGKRDLPKQVFPGRPLPSDKGPTALPKSEPAAPQVQGQQPPGSPGQKSTAPPEPGAPPAAKALSPDAPKGAGPGPGGQKDLPKQVVPGVPLPSEKGPTASPKGEPTTPQAKGPQAPGSPPPAVIAPPPLRPDRAPRETAPGPRLEELKTGRTQRTEDDGRRTVIQEPGPGNRVIIKQDNRIIIRHDESERFRRLHRDARTERRPDGNSETFYVRSDGVHVVSVVDTHGRLVRRYRRDRDGREFSIIDNRRFLRNAGIVVGVGALGLAIALNLPPPRIRIPREQYIVEYDRASDDDLYNALNAPPVEELERSYSLEEVRFNHELRQRMRRVDLDTITFEFGSWEVRDDQFPKLARVAKAMRRLLEQKPDELFLIAAYTDAVGSDEDNLSLSDRRAEAVAQSLSEEFGVPAENLVTQGYGEQFLKIETPGPEAKNRRVEVQRITPLIAER